MYLVRISGRPPGQHPRSTCWNLPLRKSPFCTRRIIPARFSKAAYSVLRCEIQTTQNAKWPNEASCFITHGPGLKTTENPWTARQTLTGNMGNRPPERTPGFRMPNRELHFKWRPSTPEHAITCELAASKESSLVSNLPRVCFAWRSKVWSKTLSRWRDQASSSVLEISSGSKISSSSSTSPRTYCLRIHSGLLHQDYPHRLNPANKAKS